MPGPFERGRTLLALGAARRRANRRGAARESLGAALAIFEELGTPLWAEQARAELARIGGGVASGGELDAHRAARRGADRERTVDEGGSCRARRLAENGRRTSPNGTRSSASASRTQLAHRLGSPTKPNEASPGDPLGRDEELRQIGELLDEGTGPHCRTGARRHPWERQRRRSGRRVWSWPGQETSGSSPRRPRPSAAVVAALGDLLGEVLAGTTALPEPRRQALSVALLLEGASGPPPDASLAASRPVTSCRSLPASSPAGGLDNAQWLDPPSREALEFALRRLDGNRVRLLCTARADAEELLSVPGSERLTVGPLSLGAVRELLHSRLGVQLPRPTLVTLHETAAGNPLFALELASALGGDLPAGDEPLPLPRTLGELVAARLERVHDQAAQTLLAIAVLARPTNSAVVAAVGDPAAQELQLLLDAGVVEADGDRLRFAHPLLASATLAKASPPTAAGCTGRSRASPATPKSVPAISVRPRRPRSRRGGHTRGGRTARSPARRTGGSGRARRVGSPADAGRRRGGSPPAHTRRCGSPLRRRRHRTRQALLEHALRRRAARPRACRGCTRARPPPRYARTDRHGRR